MFRARDARPIIADGDRAVVVRDARTLRPLRRFPALAYAGAVSPDARTFAIGGQDGGQDGSVRFLDLRTGKRRTASGRHAGAVQGGVFTPDGRFLVTVGDDTNAIVWDVATARAVETFRGHAGRVLAAALDRSARTLYTAGLDGSVIAWDLAGDRRLGRMFEAGTGTGDWFPSTAISGDGRSLATLQDRGAVSLVDLPPFARVRSRPCRRRSRRTRPPSGRAGRSSSAAWTASSRSSTRARAASWPACADTATSSSPPRRARTGAIIASTGLDGTLRLWDARAARALGPPIRLGGPPTSDAGISPDGARVAVSLVAGTVDVFDVRSHRRVARLRVDAGIPRSRATRATGAI